MEFDPNITESVNMKRLQIISVAMVLVLSPQFPTTAKAEVTTKIHLNWNIYAKTRAFAPFIWLAFWMLSSVDLLNPFRVFWKKLLIPTLSKS